MTLADQIMSMDAGQWREFLRSGMLSNSCVESGPDIVRAALRRFACEHLNNAGPNNQSFGFRDITVYVRISHRMIQRDRRVARMIDIANVEVPLLKRSKGIFTRFLGVVEEEAAVLGFGVYVESIFNPILKDALVRRGYLIKSDDTEFAVWDALWFPER